MEGGSEDEEEEEEQAGSEGSAYLPRDLASLGLTPSAVNAVTEQPRYGQAANAPGEWIRCFEPLDGMYVQQTYTIVDVVLPCEGPRKFTVLNKKGQRALYAVENSNSTFELICGRPRFPWTVRVCDSQTREVMVMQRMTGPGVICPGWPCFPDFVKLKSANGNHLIGQVRRLPNPLCPAYALAGGDMVEVLTVRGPCCLLMLFAGLGLCCKDETFIVQDMQGETVGAIRKHYEDTFKAMIKAEHFSCTFPELKAAMLASVFFIDFSYYTSPFSLAN
ncbi:phospholipid scramblase 1-like isoform X2 [Littorina saxatilis]|uniref:phospholipid scramblase 1-like isoform X2 n=1 Tax=Littorina saxatilis TaxID=31220 RepID=UPI0038B686B7